MSSPEPAPSTTKDSSFAGYLRAEPVLLAVLFALAVVAFTAVTGLSRLYFAQQDSLGKRWFARGVADLAEHHYDAAELEFRTALRYSRDEYSYQLNLAEALLGLKRTPEAEAYLLNLFERQPENGLVNLELARIAAQRGDTEHTLRYYNNAIYATWSDESPSNAASPNTIRSNDASNEQQPRREARLELIEYLLKINATTQAQAELIALAANLGNDPEQQRRLGDLFIRAQDYEHALAAYRTVLRTEHHNASAEAGAGEAAFQLAQYRVALRYLQTAVADNPSDAATASLLKTTEVVTELDPYGTGVAAAQRNQTVRRDFEIAGQRLKTCGLATGSVGSISSTAPTQQSLGDRWAQMKPRVTERGLERDPDLTDSAMGLVFEIEQQATANCGSPTDADEALLLIAKSREGR